MGIQYGGVALIVQQTEEDVSWCDKQRIRDSWECRRGGGLLAMVIKVVLVNTVPYTLLYNNEF